MVPSTGTRRRSMAARVRKLLNVSSGRRALNGSTPDAAAVGTEAADGGAGARELGLAPGHRQLVGHDLDPPHGGLHVGTAAVPDGRAHGRLLVARCLRVQ